MWLSTEERNKAKQSYQESLQNVTTVRQQAAVSHFHSFTSCAALHSVDFTVDVPVGTVQILAEHELYSGKAYQRWCFNSHFTPLHCPPFSWGTAAVSAHKCGDARAREPLRPVCNTKHVSFWIFCICLMMCLGKRSARRGIGAFESPLPFITLFFPLGEWQ